jgi:hypothetical protein
MLGLELLVVAVLENQELVTLFSKAMRIVTLQREEGDNKWLTIEFLL